MATLNDLATPAFVANRRAFRLNCDRVRKAAYENGVFRLRPHIKTHKTREGCLIQAGYGYDGEDSVSAASASVIGFVVSTMPELSMLVDIACHRKVSPFNDILYGIPLCKSKLADLFELKKKLASATDNIGIVHLLIDHADQLSFLEEFIIDHHSVEADEIKWSVFLKVDTGYHRAGVSLDSKGVAVAERIVNSKHVELKGLYSHCGHAYNSDDANELEDIVVQDTRCILEFISALEQSMINTESLDVSVGSTPSMFYHKKLPQGLEPTKLEIHPGNYVFFDRQQLYTGACADESWVAAFILARVIGHYDDSDRNAIMLDAGATALTKESTPQGGMCAVLGRPELECYRMSQEVTMVRCRDGTPFPFEDFPLGSTVLLIPNHSCLAAACFGVYYVVDEEGGMVSKDSKIVDKWEPVRGWT